MQKETTNLKKPKNSKSINKTLKKADFDKDNPNEDNFTLYEVKDIHQRQLDDPFYDIQNMRNSVKLENLNLGDRIPINEIFKSFGLDKLMVAKATTIASSSKKDEEQEIELYQNKLTKLQVPENKEDGESDSNKPFQDDTNLDITANMMKAEIESSFTGLIKERSRKAEDSE